MGFKEIGWKIAGVYNGRSGLFRGSMCAFDEDVDDAAGWVNDFGDLSS